VFTARYGLVFKCNSDKSLSLKVLKWIFCPVVSPKKHKYVQIFTFPESLQHAVRIGNLMWSEHRFLVYKTELA